MEELDKGDFLKVLKKDKPKYIEFKDEFHYRMFCGNYSKYTFYHKTYFYSTNCFDCALSLNNEIEKSGIEIIKIVD